MSVHATRAGLAFMLLVGLALLGLSIGIAAQFDATQAQQARACHELPEVCQ